MIGLLVHLERNCSLKRRARVGLRESQPMAMRFRLLQQALHQLRRATGQANALANCSGEASPLSAATCAPPQSKVDASIL